MKKRTITFDRFVRILISVVILGVAYFLIRRLSNVLVPFLVAWLIAYLLYPMVKFFQYRLRFKYRMLSIIATMVACIEHYAYGFADCGAFYWVLLSGYPADY